jgi:ribonuclease P protein component
MERLSQRLGKRERLSGHKQIDALFGGGSQSVTVYPIRAIYRLSECSPGLPLVRIMTSVPKRHFKHAVDRNRVKRQLRESYRHQKQLLFKAMQDHTGQELLLAFIWLSDHHEQSVKIAQRMSVILQRIRERL